MRRAALISTISLSNFSVLLSRLALSALTAALIVPAQQPETILVAAAADLARTREDMSASFTKATSYAARFTYAGSGMLARQIEQGAPFDVFLSANQGHISSLVESGKLRRESVREYAGGRLALWSRQGRIRGLEDLAAPGIRHIAIANPAHAPYGLAAQEALKMKGLWEKLKDRIVYGENVRQALQFAQTGNADAAVTAWPLIFDRGGVLLPRDAHPPIRQVGAVLSSTRHREAAEAFMRFLSSPEGRKMLVRYGFD